MQDQRQGGLCTATDDGSIFVPAQRMSASERLERWASALELRRTRCLPTIDDSGFWVRARLRRTDGSPLAVAYDDWALRAEGLDGDTMVDAIAFFGLSAAELRRLIGASHHGRSVPAAAVATAIRTMTRAGRASPAIARPGSGWAVASASVIGLLALVLVLPLVLASL